MAKIKLLYRELTPEYRDLLKRFGRIIDREALSLRDDPHNSLSDPQNLTESFWGDILPYAVADYFEETAMDLLKSGKGKQALSVLNHLRDYVAQVDESAWWDAKANPWMWATWKRLRAQAWMVRGVLPMPEDLRQRSDFKTPPSENTGGLHLIRLLQMGWLAYQCGEKDVVSKIRRYVLREARSSWNFKDDLEEQSDIHMMLLDIIEPHTLAQPETAPSLSP